MDPEEHLKSISLLLVPEWRYHTVSVICRSVTKARERESEYRRRERRGRMMRWYRGFFCMILSVAGSSRIFFFLKSLERLRRGQSYLDDTDAWTCLLQLKHTQPLHLVPPCVPLMAHAYGILCPFFFFLFLLCIQSIRRTQRCSANVIKWKKNM